MKGKLLRFILIPFLCIAFVPMGRFLTSSRAMTEQAVPLEGLIAPVRVVRDSNDIPHIFAQNDHDAIFMLGYIHAQDRFFQMDLLRRTLSGTLAELVGPSALESDVQLRTLGLRRAAEESVPAHSSEGRALLQAYADGVNAFVFDPDHPLPPEYQALELTKASVPPWTPVDSVVIGKGLAFQLSFDGIQDIELTEDLAAYQEAGEAGGFDGTVLFMEDVFRSAPFDPSVSIPGFTPGGAAAAAARRKQMIEAARNLREVVSPEALKLARQYLEKIKNVPFLQSVFHRRDATAGSNWWIVSGSVTESGYPIMANDPHLSLNTPSIFYEAHLIVENDPEFGPMNVNGVSFAGTPVIVLGCNDRICWGATTNPMDVTDVYQERLILNPATRLPGWTRFENRREPLSFIVQVYRVNQVGDGELDNIEQADVPPDEGGLTLIVPRRNNGPIVAVDASNLLRVTGLSIQYTGWRATRELETFRIWARARNLDDFKQGLQFFDFGSQNWAYADVDGNIAYFTSAELPLREDLQELEQVDGVPPFFIRDGTHEHKNEWLPLRNPQPGQAINYEILPAEEMPHVVNPPQGFVANANNDPVGTTVDNNPLNQLRPGGGIYYLNVGYDGGFRIGRIRRLIEAAIANGGKISVADMKRFQANNQMLDAEVLTPYILAAFQNAQSEGAPDMLAALADDPQVAEAVARLSVWDFSTPTGIRRGYDPGDDPDNLPEPTDQDIRHSVAATIYSVWRSRIIRNTIDATLIRLGLGDHLPGSDQAMAALRHLLETFDTRQGLGASGVNFFQVDGAPTPEAARDFLILKSLREALDLLAGDAFAPAFDHSTNQRDYRWGRLHRIVFDHPLRGPFDIPEAGGFSHLAPDLPGVARSGGFDVVDASGHSARASSVNGFMFGGGPARRFVGEMTPAGVNGFEIIPGGESGVVSSPFYASMLGRWLTNRYHPMLLRPNQVEADRMSEQVFEPAP